MHTVVVRRDVYEKNPWVAQSLYKAFVIAQREAYQELYQAGTLSTMLPWLVRHAEETRGVMGNDFWLYGFEPNRHTLSTFLRYSWYSPWEAVIMEARTISVFMFTGLQLHCSSPRFAGCFSPGFTTA